MDEGHQFNHKDEGFNWEIHWRDRCEVKKKSSRKDGLFGTEIFKEIDQTCLVCFVLKLWALFYWQGLPDE